MSGDRSAQDWLWIPGSRVGPFWFGRPLPSEVPWPVELLPPSMDGAEWKTFRVGDELARVSIEDESVIHVECAASLCFEGVELVGMEVLDVRRLLSGRLTLVEDELDGSQTWECDGLGLTLWVQDGRVESATVGPPV